MFTQSNILEIFNHIRPLITLPHMARYVRVYDVIEVSNSENCTSFCLYVKKDNTILIVSKRCVNNGNVITSKIMIDLA